MISEDGWSRLHAARSGYLSTVSAAYDEVLLEVSQRIVLSGSIGKSDIGALLFWKRLRANTPWAAELLATPDVAVRRATAPAVELVRDERLALAEAARQGRAALTSLPGFNKGDALASALLTAAAPHRMAVYDERAQSGLELLGLSLTSTKGRYGRYMQLVENLVVAGRERQEEWTPRDIDLALFWLGRPSAT
ncbi:hypothetical protein KCMC57_up57990 [Kitasatospora sp. CMC57]|uniref:Uncharacterized protein n=1 Tax=Kitasatospora sp. CMC57 TaxID=3231513 RepID=A0AB33K6V1_9ACTN